MDRRSCQRDLLRDFNKHRLVLNFYRICDHRPPRRRPHDLAGPDVEAAAVPGAGYYVSFDLPFTKRPAHVCARVVRGVEGTAEVEQRASRLACLHHLRCSWITSLTCATFTSG